MDFITHSLWGLTAVRKRKLFWLTVLFSTLPDVAYLLYLPYKFFSLQTFSFQEYLGPEGITEQNLVNFYYFTHSFFAALLVFVILYLFKRKHITLMLPYTLHILLDIPVHCGLFATRFLYPFSSFHICGIIFEEHMLPILFLSYLTLGIINIFIWKGKFKNP